MTTKHIKNHIIVDLDGTLALERHRRPLIKKSWEDYFANIHLDCVNESVLHFLEIAEYASHRIHIFTSRPSRYRGETLEWLNKHNIPHDTLEMRADVDTNLGSGGWQSLRTDEEVKTEMLTRHKLSPDNVVCVLEDRDAMCDFYRVLGYDCWQVHPQHEMYVPEEGERL